MTMPASIRRLSGFVVAGGIGFTVDAGITEGLVAGGFNPYLARVVAVAVAIATTYAINSGYTWKSGATQRPARRGARYLAVSLASMAINYGVYAAATHWLVGLRPALCVALGSAVAMVTNYLGYARFVFASDDDQAA
jgi:putative flippase GtrA